MLPSALPAHCASLIVAAPKVIALGAAVTLYVAVTEHWLASYTVKVYGPAARLVMVEVAALLLQAYTSGAVPPVAVTLILPPVLQVACVRVGVPKTSAVGWVTW
jgi:hypothetical protein